MLATTQRLKTIIRDIEETPFRVMKKSVAHSFELTAEPILISNLSGWIGAVIVRSILKELTIDEHRIFKWRPENKYNQYLIFTYYAPSCMPHTLSLLELLQYPNWVKRLKKLIKAGYFIKATLGFGSGRTRSFDRTTEIEQILQSYHELPVLKEEWILQRKLKLRQEYRVHTFCQDILFGMTFKSGGPNETNSFAEVQDFTYQILKKLPLSLLADTLIGWDIGITDSGKYYVIEANFTGFHPEYRIGFQTSGYFDEMPFGPILCALLNMYFKQQYGIAIRSIENSLLSKFPFLEEFKYYLSIFKTEHVKTIHQEKGSIAAVYIYFGKKTDYLMVKLVSYLQLADWAHSIYIITNRRLQNEARKLFNGAQIKHLNEESLLAGAVREKSGKLTEARRKKLCCELAIELTKERSYLII